VGGERQLHVCLEPQLPQPKQQLEPAVRKICMKNSLIFETNHLMLNCLNKSRDHCLATPLMMANIFKTIAEFSHLLIQLKIDLKEILPETRELTSFIMLCGRELLELCWYGQRLRFYICPLPSESDPAGFLAVIVH
jgi:hypothetical protein